MVTNIAGGRKHSTKSTRGFLGEAEKRGRVMVRWGRREKLSTHFKIKKSAVNSF